MTADRGAAPAPASRRGQPRVGEILLADGALSADELGSALRQQAREGGDLGDHLVAGGAVSRLDLYRALAAQWGLPLRDLLRDPPDAAVATSVRHREAQQLGWLACEESGGRLVVATTRRPDDALREEVAVRFGALPVDFVATTRWDLFRAVELLHRPAIHRQSGETPEAPTLRGPDRDAVRDGLGARRSWSVRVAAVLLVGSLTAVAVTTIGPAGIAAVALLLSASALVAAVLVRIVLAARAGRLAGARIGSPDVPLTADRHLPVYSVLVPVGAGDGSGGDVVELLATLDAVDAVDYPSTRLDVLVLPADGDEATLAALRGARLPPWVRIVAVPDDAATTLGRACNYGLAFARGRLVVRYDVGDRPSPDQLRRVVAAFAVDARDAEAAGDQRGPLACLQAPVRPRPDGRLMARQDAVGWAGWFRLLSGAGGTGVVLPLGATSHHVDADVLRSVGCWHPRRTVEATDLSVRLRAAGYRVDTLGAPSETSVAPVGGAAAAAALRARWASGALRTALRALGRSPGPRSVAALLPLAVLQPLASLAWALTTTLTLVLWIAAATGREVASWAVPTGLGVLAGVHLVSAVLALLAARRSRSDAPALDVLLDPVAWPVQAWSSGRAVLAGLRTDD